MGAERFPVRVMQVDVVFTAYPFAFAHRIVEIFQLVLGINILCKDGVF